ncbi:MAG: hypothetical protein IJB91_05605, partial [Oscillospiraceae bacterium]|nr:hypothetical protein [Oscillospiraceae bacterium]
YVIQLLYHWVRRFTSNPLLLSVRHIGIHLSPVYFFLSFKRTHNLSDTGVSLDYATNAIPICRFYKVLECFFYFAHNITPSLVFLDHSGLLQNIKRLMGAI